MPQESEFDRISHKAHEIWESEGRPHGRDQQHWDQAKEIIALHDSMGDTLLPRDTGASEPAEPKLSADANGDIPNLTDQGQDDLTDTAREPEVTRPKAKSAPPKMATKSAKPAEVPKPEETQASPVGNAAPVAKPATAKPAPSAKPAPASKTAGKPAGKR